MIKPEGSVADTARVVQTLRQARGKKLLEEFEYTIGMAKLRAYSKRSLEGPLSDFEFKEMMALKERLLPTEPKVRV